MFSAATKSAHSAATAANYIEDVFSTYLYTGNDSAQTLTNGIDMAGYGGLSILKIRNYTGESFGWFDTVRGANKILKSAGTQAESTVTNYLNSFNSNGITIGSNQSVSNYNYVSWSFRKQAKFFDVVTYTGNGSNRTIAHSLGSVPGCIIVKRTDTTADWQVYHRSLANTEYMVLNATAAKATGATRWNSTTPTSSVFSLGTDTTVNANGGTYVAYLFAHDAGGFGASGTDNVISCGSYTISSGAANSVNLGYEPQYILVKNATTASDGGNWWIWDTMRGLVVDNGSGTGDKYLYANTSGAEGGTYGVDPTATGFNLSAGWGDGQYIYIAIRRGPMKTPTTGTSVFKPSATTASSGTLITTNFPVDMELGLLRTIDDSRYVRDRLRGYASSASSTTSPYLQTNATDAETTGLAPFSYNWWNKSVNEGDYPSGYSQVSYYFGRAPGFFDEVCYTGTGSARTVTHNLGVVPEMMIVKCRSSSGYQWSTYVSSLGNTKRIYLSLTDAAATSSTVWNNTSPTSSVFTVGTSIGVNESSQTYVAYLFATVAGVSKVGSYTGTGTTQQINCGFSGGARFVLIKRTDSTGDWYVWDSARGIVAGNDPYLLLNSIAAETTNTDYVDTYSAGFEISSTAPAAINANGGSFIYLAIA